jgi:hypothetical protein
MNIKLYFQVCQSRKRYALLNHVLENMGFTYLPCPDIWETTTLFNFESCVAKVCFTRQYQIIQKLEHIDNEFSVQRSITWSDFVYEPKLIKHNFDEMYVSFKHIRKDKQESSSVIF